MIKQQLENYLPKYHATLLGVGPMSLNCTDAAIDLANQYEIPLMLIASRRQIDSEEFGGGYVNNWTTEKFSDYVIDRDKKGKILLARDHGGPWQNEQEKSQKLSLRRAMDSAKLSFRADIDAKFQIIHIDTSVDIFSKPTVDEIIDRVFELYEYCWNYAQQQGQDIIFEIGTEEQTGSTNTQEELDYLLNKIFAFCNENRLPKPTFVVVQTGTRVVETRNIGSFDSPIRVAKEIPAEIQVPKMVEICKKHGILLKQHNTDYLSDETLKWHPRLGIHSANVAPEFGVAETDALIRILEMNNLQKYAEDFLQLAYDSNKWKKWMLPSSNATDRDRSIIAGHYIFATEKVSILKERAAVELKKKGIELEYELKDRVKTGIMRYLKNFRMVRTI